MRASGKEGKILSPKKISGGIRDAKPVLRKNRETRLEGSKQT